MPSIKGHFDGSGIVLDEPPPATLAVGQAVRVVVDAPESAAPAPAFTPFVEMTATLMTGDDWDEGVALHVDSLDRVPADFVRRPGSAAGQVTMADDFDRTPEEFKDYL